MRILFILCSLALMSISDARSEYDDVNSVNAPPPAGEAGVSRDQSTRMLIDKPARADAAYQLRQSPKGPRIDLNSPDLVAQVAAVNKEIKDGVMFTELTGLNLDSVRASLKSFTELALEMERSPSEAQINEERLAEQDKVNAILDKAQKDSIFICYSEKITGSHYVYRKCRTVAQMRRLREKSQDNYLRRGESKLDAPRNGGGGRAAFGGE